MDTTSRQRTIGGPVAVEGVGYWSGQDVRVEFRPAEAGTGRVFVRADLPDRPRIPARVENRINTPLRSSLRCHGATVEMVEHVMAALGGLRIDNCEIWVDAAEMPGCDGSCLPFVEALDQAGLVIQDTPRARITVTEPLCVSHGPARLHATPTGDGATRLTYHLDYGATAIGRQAFSTVLTPETFRCELAPSRTFLLL
ncbi:MAG: UDP-3-O-acyl-N-acetylglucosamine deacetylase, partial [Pirellulales bacterium]|nr:UDP-3-O-acyl-N-acetylglucosamine deacetylase [Pirellulales bacterium]